MAVQTEPSNDNTFKMLKYKPEEPFIIRKDLLWIILIFLKPLSKTYEAIELFMLMLMSTSNKLCGAWMNIQGWLQGRNLLGGQIWLIIFLLLLCEMAPSAAYADIPECSPGSRSRHDSILDADDVKTALFEGSTQCNFSHQGYHNVCEDAFDHMLCPAIDLTGNRLSSLPSAVLQYAVNVNQVFLDGNTFFECPMLINDNLMFLSINDNPLEQFSNQSTIYLPNLTILSVENCRNLSAIDEAAFENNHKLKRVRFSGTPLQKLSSPCSNCFNFTLEGPDTVHLMCGSGPDIVTFESKRAENFFLNNRVEMLSQTNNSITNRLICITQANSETHSTAAILTSTIPTSATPTSVTLASATPASATPTSPILTLTTPTSATPTAVPTSATPTAAILTSTTPTSATPKTVTPASATPASATPTTATPTSATPTSATPTSVFWIIIGVVLALALSILVMVLLYRKVIQPWCKKSSCISNQNEMDPQNEPWQPQEQGCPTFCRGGPHEMIMMKEGAA